MNLPNDSSLDKRGRAIEDAYFAQKDRQLLDALKRQLATQQPESALASITGVSDEIVIKNLSTASEPHFLAVMGIYPLIAVAWADGSVTDDERRTLLAEAHGLGIEHGSAAHDLMDAWLQTRPAESFGQAWADYVHAVCQTLDADSIDKLKKAIISRAEKVAKASGGFMGFGNKISEQEQKTLKSLEQAFRS